jgi:SPP1 gp7 family putative phage head morphogenesis protein
MPDGFDLPAMARRKGINGELTLAQIDPAAHQEEQLRRAIMDVVRHWSKGRKQIIEAYSEPQTAMQVVLNALRADASPIITDAQGKFATVLKEVGAWHTGEWGAVVVGALDIDVKPLLRAETIEPILRVASRDSALLIKDVSNQTARRIGEATFEAYESGAGRAALEKNLRETMKLPKHRARLISRDQLGKFTGKLDEARQTEAGIRAYEWSTVGDHRVRPEHRALDGEQFNWDEAGPDGHPGDAIACRCRAMAVIPGF